MNENAMPAYEAFIAAMNLHHDLPTADTADARDEQFAALVGQAYFAGDSFAEMDVPFVAADYAATYLRVARGVLGEFSNTIASDLIDRALESLQTIQDHLCETAFAMQLMRDHAEDCAGGEEEARALAAAWLGEDEYKAA